MKKIVLLLLTCVAFSLTHAQDKSTNSNSPVKKINLSNRPGDHLMFQLYSEGWTNRPDSISSHQKGFSRGFAAYFMFDKPFKSSPKFSLGIGVGASTSNIFFKKMGVDIRPVSSLLPFQQLDSTNHFKKFKVATTYLEIPLELRFTAKPDNYNKSWKAAIGLKVGTLVDSHTKGKTLVDKNNSVISNYSQKITAKGYVNGTKFTATARVGYGAVTLFGSYGLTNVLKDGVGPAMKSYQIGLTLSGL